jgi:hypothetical protein
MVHHETNLWQAQGNLVGTSKCGWMNDLRWFPTIPRYHLFGLEAQEGHLACTQKLDIFHSIIDDIWFSSHMGASHLGHHELTNMWRFGGVVGCPTDKAPFAYATLETIMFHYGWCPTRTLNIRVGCILFFNFLLHSFMFLYYVNMKIM